MKRLRKNTRGQFVVVAALLIALLTLSVALSIHQINLHRQQLRYEPVEELVLGITSDLDRCLTHALSIASQQYYETGSKEKADSAGYNFISKWVRSIIASYSHLGVKMNMSVPNPTAGGRKDVDFHYGWYKGWGLSQVYTKFDLDIDAYGFKGWVGHSGKFVNLTIFPESITPANQSTTLKFQIMQGKDQPIPIPNLIPESLKIWVNITRTLRVPANITYLSYLGGGNYNVKFRPSINTNYTFWVELTAVTPEDNIYVSAYFDRYVNVSVALDSLEENNATQHKGSIQLGDITYTPLPAYSSPEPGFSYLLRYTPENVSYTFLNWTTTGDVHVAYPYSIVTSVKIDGNGSITAFYSRYTPPKPAIVNLLLDSREWNNLTIHLGSITLGSTNYNLSASVNLTVGNYPLQYEPCNSSYFFIEWEFSGDVIPASTVSNPTTLLVIGNGTVMAVYASKPPTPPTPTLVNVTLQSMDENSSAPANLGKIQFGGALFELPNSTTVLSGTYLLEYIPEEGCIFLNWTTTENITVQNLNSRITSVTVKGNGTITAFYRTPPPVSVTLQSLEETLAPPGNLGKIQLGATLFELPNSTTVVSGTYLLSYIPEEGYTFLNWTTTAGISVEDPYSPVTSVTINNNGTITAFYRGCKVFLDSIAWDNSSQSLGKITLGSNSYTLPKYVTGLPIGDYMLQYEPYNSSYVFLWWESSGYVFPWNSTSSNTTLTVYGDGTVTAVYLISGPPPPPPPPPQGWNILYVDAGYKLMPPFMWSGKSSHLPSKYSTGIGKQVANLTSPPTPTIYLARYVKVTAYVRPNPPWNAKDVTLELGFTYNGEYYLLGSGTYPINSQGVYFMEIDILNGQFPGEIGVIPEGSVIILTVTVTFFQEPWGTFFLYYGPDRPSRIELF